MTSTRLIRHYPVAALYNLQHAVGIMNGSPDASYPTEIQIMLACFKMQRSNTKEASSNHLAHHQACGKHLPTLPCHSA